MIRQARPRDTPAILNLLAEATGWLAEKGIDQWQGPLGRRESLIRRDTGVRAVWVVTHLGRVTATITVDHLADADFWRPDDRVRSALYVHRMAVARSEAGIGLGAATLDWAADRVVKSGRTRLRLDAWATNDALHQYYKGLGFDMIRNEPVPGRGSGALFERPAFVKLGGGPPLLTPAAARQAAQATSVVAHDDERLRIGRDLVPA
ncbi:GNAT family N-acetyltransferase [Pseudonocardia saturnea]